MEIFSYLKSRRICNAESNTKGIVQLVTVLYFVCGRKSSPRTDLASSLGTGWCPLAYKSSKNVLKIYEARVINPLAKGLALQLNRTIGLLQILVFTEWTFPIFIYLMVPFLLCWPYFRVVRWLQMANWIKYWTECSSGFEPSMNPLSSSKNWGNLSSMERILKSGTPE
jgi:hypothetical protein